MTFAQSIRTCFAKYITFAGRASRSEYWWFFLFILLGNIATSILDTALFGWDGGSSDVNFSGTEFEADTSYQAGPLGTIFGLGTLLPALSAGWRRMHDTGRAGYMLFYPLMVMAGIFIWLALYGNSGVIGGPLVTISIFVLLISPLLVLWWLSRPSQPDDNNYGPPPALVTP